MKSRLNSLEKDQSNFEGFEKGYGSSPSEDSDSHYKIKNQKQE
jgi:hypothetical protein